MNAWATWNHWLLILHIYYKVPTSVRMRSSWYDSFFHLSHRTHTIGVKKRNWEMQLTCFPQIPTTSNRTVLCMWWNSVHDTFPSSNVNQDFRWISIGLPGYMFFFGLGYPQKTALETEGLLKSQASSTSTCQRGRIWKTSDEIRSDDFMITWAC